jgi:hypothetical protein
MIYDIPRDSQNYGKQFWENILQLMENSAQDYPPFLSQEGQLWYDSLNRILKISKKDEYGLQNWYPVGRDTPIDLTKYVNTLYENTIQDLKLVDDISGDTVYSGDNKNSNYAVTKKYVDNWNGGIKNIRTKKYDYTLFPNGYMIIRGFSKGDIVLPKVMNDTNYSVTITNDNNAELYKVTNKTVNGFTVNADNWMMCGFLTNYKPIIKSNIVQYTLHDPLEFINDDQPQDFVDAGVVAVDNNGDVILYGYASDKYKKVPVSKDMHKSDIVIQYPAYGSPTEVFILDLELMPPSTKYVFIIMYSIVEHGGILSGSNISYEVKSQTLKHTYINETISMTVAPTNTNKKARSESSILGYFEMVNGIWDYKKPNNIQIFDRMLVFDDELYPSITTSGVIL